jgi:transcriptional regulator with XRE-family HTH domain
MKNVNEKANFADRFRELCNASTQDILAMKFDVTKNTFRQWINGYSTPTVDKLIKLSEYFGVSTDYLLGLSDTKSPNAEIQTVINATGLTEEAVIELTSMPVIKGYYSDESRNNKNRQHETMRYREIINLLLTSEHGKRALTRLAYYFIGQIPKNAPEYVPLPAAPGEDFESWLSSISIIPRELICNCALELVKDEFKEMQSDIERDDIVTKRLAFLKEQKNKDIPTLL